MERFLTLPFEVTEVLSKLKAVDPTPFRCNVPAMQRATPELQVNQTFATGSEIGDFFAGETASFLGIGLVFPPIWSLVQTYSLPTERPAGVMCPRSLWANLFSTLITDSKTARIIVTGVSPKRSAPRTVTGCSERFFIWARSMTARRPLGS